MMADVAAPRSRVENRPGQNRSELRDLYDEHRASLVRLAALVVPGDAEEIVQDAFVRAYIAWDRLRAPDKALAYLRSTVLNGARSRARHLRVVGRTDPPHGAPAASPEAAAVARDEHNHVIAALRALPRRQRECLALRYYVDLSETEIANTLGISNGSVKTHIHRGLAALAHHLEPS